MATPADQLDDANPVDSPSTGNEDPAKSLANLLVPAPAQSASASSSSSSPTKKNITTSLPAAPVLRTESPRVSRETSPIRTQPPKLASGAAKLSRSRKNSQELSPHRSATTPTLPDAPSSAAVQRALSAQGVPRIASPGAGDAAGDAQRQQRPARGTAANSSQPVANTSRVKSPPRSATTAKPNTPTRKPDTVPATPDISINSPPPNKPASFFEGIEPDEASNRASPRSPSRPAAAGSTLEVVQESAAPETPAIDVAPPSSVSRSRAATQNSQQESQSQKDTKAGVTSTESESEGTSKKTSDSQTQDDAMKSSQSSTASKPPNLQSRKSLSQLSTSKGKTGGDGSVRSMTVETETVSSVPQLSVGGNASDRAGASRSDGGGTIRVKPSTETIRPKKDRKKPARKAVSAAGGTSSKADIFEAKVATAVDEADSSDSGETFVYESNPPESHPRSTSRYHHSRTPSATSMASQADIHGRPRNDGHNSIIGKKSMKFTNSFHNLADLPDTEDAPNGRHVVGNSSHHIGRWGRSGGNHVSILGGDVVSTPTRIRAGTQARHSSRPNTPRSANFLRTPASAKFQKFNGNDLDDDEEEEAADDERTPLVHPAQASRNRHSRRIAGARYSNRGVLRNERTIFKGVFGWILLGVLVSLLVAAIIVALVLCSKPLRNVHIGEISNVIASEEEVVFDLRMFALNPDIISIQVDKLDMKIFAKSKYVGSSRLNRASRRSNDSDYNSWDNVDEGTDPIEEPGGSDTMLLGRVYHLDSPLSFAPSPFAHHQSSDVGEISFPKPGNRTADDGTERWKRVVEHPFDLIVVGQLKYTLPISSKIHSVSVGQGKTRVEPGSSVGKGSGIARPPMPGPVRMKSSRPVEFVS